MGKRKLEIEVQEKETKQSEGLQLPMNFLSMGEVEQEDVKVYIRQDIYRALEKYASTNLEKELGSILVGDWCEVHGKRSVLISAFIKAKYTDASASTLTFTHETWDYVNKEKEKRYPDQKIVGWQHTHPNYGIFLSNYDMFIQENFFNLPFQIAYVIDPVQKQRGFFQWKNGKIEKLKGFFLYDEVGKAIRIEAEKPKVFAEKKPGGKKLLTTILAALAAVLAVAVLWLSGQVSNQEELRQSLEEKIAQRDQTIVLLQQEILAMQQPAEPAEGETEEGTPTMEEEALRSRLEAYEQQIIDQEAELQALREQIAAMEADGDLTMHFQAYTVQLGDKMTGICEAHGFSYSDYWRIILAFNTMDSPDQIYVGQELLLPVVE